MKKKVFQSKIGVALTTVLVLVVVGAVYVNFTLQSIVGNLTDAAKPDQRMLYLKGLIADLSEAERNVKSYGLTKEVFYLDDYNASIDAVHNSLRLLYASALEDNAYTVRIKQVDRLINRKFNVLDELLVVENEQTVEEVIEKMQQTVDELETEPVLRQIETNEAEKRGFFKRLFGNRKDKKEDKSTSELSNKEQQKQWEDYAEKYKSVEQELTELQQKENANAQRLRNQELSLIQQDKAIMRELAAIFDELEVEEQAAMVRQVNNAEQNGKITGALIALFCILSCVLLAIAGYTIYNYYTKNERHKAALKMANRQMESKNKDILDSINYAKRIQTTILPQQKKLDEYLKQRFVIYKPKDIVAGDFYWIMEVDGYTFIAVADCTGHGVPGAMVSITCSAALNRSIKEFGLRKPARILDKARELVIEAFEQDNFEVYDGMDIALCRIDKKVGRVQFAGANNPLYVVNNGKLKELKGDKQPVAKYHKIKPFGNQEHLITPGDKFYLFSDGLPDQFGGPKGKKYMYGRFKKLLESIWEHSIEEQGQVIENSLISWQGNYEQIDDICVIGFEIKA